MKLKQLQIVGGVCAILEALIYIATFIVYGAVLNYPNEKASPTEKLRFLSDNYLTLSLVNWMSYILFGLLLVILVVAIHYRIKKSSPLLSNFATIFGIIWVGLVIASGMIINVGLHTVIGMEQQAATTIMSTWTNLTIIAEGLGGGNEMVGGIWVLLLSVIALKHQLFSKLLNLLGFLVGIAGILTVYPSDIFTEIFGISQIIWFLWLGIFMIGRKL